MCVTKKKKKSSYLVTKTIIRNTLPPPLSLSLSLSHHHLSEFSVKFTKEKINHLNKIKKIKNRNDCTKKE
jgi:hypothetical protein